MTTMSSLLPSRPSRWTARSMPMPSGKLYPNCCCHHPDYHDHRHLHRRHHPYETVLRHSLMTFGVKFSASEVDDAFAEMKIDEVRQ